MFYSFFQRSNILAKSSSALGQCALRRENVNLKVNLMELTIRSSKTTLSIQVPQSDCHPGALESLPLLMGALLVARMLAPDMPDSQPFLLAQWQGLLAATGISWEGDATHAFLIGSRSESITGVQTRTRATCARKNKTCLAPMVAFLVKRCLICAYTDASDRGNGGVLCHSIPVQVNQAEETKYEERVFAYRSCILDVHKRHYCA
jgi:hypothetical protein